MNTYSDCDLCFEDNNENDDDIGALGSILSWDDDEQANDAANGVASNMSSALRDREFSSATSTASSPPDTVQFSVKDGLSQFNFLQQNLSNFHSLQSQGCNEVTTTEKKTNSNNASNINLGLPLPTPISSFVLQNHDQKQLDAAFGAGVVSHAVEADKSQQSEMSSSSQTHQGLAANFAQLLAQQANQFLQQQANRGQQQQQTSTQEQQQQHSQQHSSCRASAQGGLVQQNQQQVSQNTQQQQPMQLMYTADPNTFLQQLQYAQLQQQFQVAQAQQQNVSASSNTSQMSNSLQQFPTELPTCPTSNVPIAAGPAPPSTKSRTSSRQRTSQPPNKKARIGPSLKKEGNQGPSQTQSMQLVTSGGISSGVVSASDTDIEIKKKSSKKSSSSIVHESGNTSDSQNFSTDDKVKANRDRNREHARNTRLRKKAYLEKLQGTVDELCRERDTLMSERTGAANLLVEMHNTRTEVLMSFFALRSTNEKRRMLWASILDESCFACVMPVTPYRSFPASEVQVSRCQRTILGIDAMIADTASLHVLFDSLVDRSKCSSGQIQFRYTLVTEEAVVAGNQMMARWVMSTTNAVQCGARMEVAKQGMLCCKFNSAHKITGLELMFDVMAFMLQLKQAAGSDGFSVIPNTVQTCQRAFDKPMVMTLAEPPYTIIQVNKLWEDMTGYSAEEVVGKKSCTILQKSSSDTKTLETMMEEIRYKRPTTVTLLNYKKSGECFRQFLLMFPLSTDSRITHYLSLSCHVVPVDTVEEHHLEAMSSQLSSQTQHILPAPSQVPSDMNRGSAFEAQHVMPPFLFAGAQGASVPGFALSRGQVTLPSPLTALSTGIPSAKMPPPIAYLPSTDSSMSRKEYSST